MTAIIQLKHICKSYEMGDSDLPILKGISLKIDAGEYVAIMGASGSGKSTLMHIMGCLDHLFSGEYFLDGISVSGQSQNRLAEIRRSKVGFIFQTFNLISKLTILENVELPLIYNRIKGRSPFPKQLLEMLGLGHRLGHYPNQLSGGERQRVAIARSLVNNPQIILADEPTGNLDSKSGQQVMKTIETLNKEGKTIILVTHDRDVAGHARKIIHIKDGKIEDIES